MITIVAQNVFKDNSLEIVMPMLEELIEESRKEDGCIKYDLYQDTKNPSMLTFIEEWRDLEAIDAHNQTDHFTRIVPLLGNHALESTVNLYKQFR